MTIYAFVVVGWAVGQLVCSMRDGAVAMLLFIRRPESDALDRAQFAAAE